MAAEQIPHVIREFLKEYEEAYPRYEELARTCETRIAALLESHGIRAIVTSRAKRPSSLRRKVLQRYPRKNYRTPADIFRDIHDLAGVRIALYFPGHRQAVRKLIRENFIVEGEKEFPESSRRVTNGYKPRFPGYCATHFRIRMHPETLIPHQRPLAGTLIEVQVASVLMHAWAEVEHDLVYKPALGGLTEQEYAILDQINGLVLAGEIALQNLEAAIGAKVGERRRPFGSHYELAAYLHGWAKERYGVEPPMGRADVLYLLHERTGLRTPAELAPYLELLDPSSDVRPLSEQIVDRMIAGNPALYELYLQVAEEAGARNPYSSSEELTLQRRRGLAAVGAFLSLWVALEKGLIHDPLASLSPEEIEQLEWLRNLRNRLIHDMEMPSTETLARAVAVARSLAVRLQQSVPAEVRAQMRDLLERLEALEQHPAGTGGEGREGGHG